jgi:hypothetical protein
MNLEIAADAIPPASSPVQFVHIEITPIIGGQFSIVMQATLLDEQELEFVGQDLANARVDTIDEALALIRSNVAVLNPPPSRAAA